MLKVIRDFFDNLIKLVDNPLVFQCQLFRQLVGDIVAIDIHQNETRCVPDLIRKIPAGFHLLLRETQVVPGAVSRHQRKAQRVRAILCDHFQRVNAVAERFAHLAPLGITDQAVDKDRLKGWLAHMLHTGEDHAGNPEEDDVIARHECIRRIEILEVFCLIRPAQRRERPQRGREPSIQGILILVQLFRATLGACMRRIHCDNRLAAILAVPRRDAVSPPELAGNAPILDVLHPIEIDLLHALRNKAHTSVADAFDCRLCQRFHLYKPLLRNARLHHGVAAVATADIVLDRLDTHQEALFFQLLDDLFARLKAGHSCKLPAVFINAAVIVHHIDDFQIVAQADFKVVRVVCGGDLHHAGPKVLLDIGIRNHRDLTANQREDQHLANDVLIARVVRMHRHGGVAQHRLRSGGGQLQIPTAVLKRIADVPEIAVLLCEFHLRVGNGGLTMRAPVDDPLATVNQALII